MTNQTSWGYTLPGMRYQRRYRSKPKEQHMTLREFGQGALVVVGFIMVGWWIVFGGVVR